MADHRLFSIPIIDSDAFLSLSIEAQNLYFHLGMRADDDGLMSSPKKVCRMLGIKETALDELADSGFLIIFASGVVAIKHWKVHNKIRSDRRRPTMCQDEFRQINSLPNGEYSLAEDTLETNVSKSAAECGQTADNPPPFVDNPPPSAAKCGEMLSEDKIIKDNIIKDKEKEKEKEVIPVDEVEVIPAEPGWSPPAPLLVAWRDWKEMRKKMKRPLTKKAEELALNKLQKLAPDFPTQLEIINQSIVNGWAGFFPLSEEKTLKQKQDDFQAVIADWRKTYHDSE